MESRRRRLPMRLLHPGPDHVGHWLREGGARGRWGYDRGIHEWQFVAVAPPIRTSSPPSPRPKRRRRVPTIWTSRLHEPPFKAHRAYQFFNGPGSSLRGSLQIGVQDWPHFGTGCNPRPGGAGLGCAAGASAVRL